MLKIYNSVIKNNLTLIIVILMIVFIWFSANAISNFDKKETKSFETYHKEYSRIKKGDLVIHKLTKDTLMVIMLMRENSIIVKDKNYNTIQLEEFEYLKLEE